MQKRERIVSADMRFERVASTSGVRTHRKKERFSLAPELLLLLLGNPHTPFMSELKILPELFRKPYLSIAQPAERWGISTRRIQILCGEGRVPGAIRIGTVWGIPEDAEKPADARIKNGKYIKKPAENEK